MSAWLRAALASDLAWIAPRSVREAAVLARRNARLGSTTWLDPRDPGTFLGVLCAAVEQGKTVAMENPDWTANEKAHAAKLVEAHKESGEILIPTGGSSGIVRLARHTIDTLAAAALAFRSIAPERAVSVCVLPLHHVGGLMQVLRAPALGGGVLLDSWRRFEAEPSLPESAAPVIASLVPTQLARLCDRAEGVEVLRRLARIYIGGAGMASTLRAQARGLGLRLCPAYGATETAAQVLCQSVESFLGGDPGVGVALPHAEALVEAGELHLRASSLFLGYVGSEPRSGPWRTGDLARLTPTGIEILGRADDSINTGGEKVAPRVIEEAVLAAGLAREALAVGVPDREWGECVGLIVAGATLQLEAMREALRPSLSRQALPKRILSVDTVPLTALGKPDRRAAKALFEQS